MKILNFLQAFKSEKEVELGVKTHLLHCNKIKEEWYIFCCFGSAEPMTMPTKFACYIVYFNIWTVFSFLVPIKITQLFNHFFKNILLCEDQ